MDLPDSWHNKPALQHGSTRQLAQHISTATWIYQTAGTTNQHCNMDLPDSWHNTSSTATWIYQTAGTINQHCNMDLPDSWHNTSSTATWIYQTAGTTHPALQHGSTRQLAQHIQHSSLSLFLRLSLFFFIRLWQPRKFHHSHYLPSVLPITCRHRPRWKWTKNNFCCTQIGCLLRSYREEASSCM